MASNIDFNITHVKPRSTDSRDTGQSRSWKSLGREAATLSLPLIMDPNHPQTTEKLWKNLVAFWTVVTAALAIALLGGIAWLARPDLASHHSLTTASRDSSSPAEDSEDSSGDEDDAPEDQGKADGIADARPHVLVTHALARRRAFRFIDADGSPVFVVGLRHGKPAVVSFHCSDIADTDATGRDGSVTRYDGDALTGGEEGPDLPGEHPELNVTTMVSTEDRQDLFLDDHGRVRILIEGRDRRFFDIRGAEAADDPESP